MTDLDSVHHNLKSQLEGLRNSIFGLQNDPKYMELFDEFLREQEFGLALETLCDFLLEPRSALASESLLEQIENLHQLMNVMDSCVQDLRDKAAQSSAL
ncbi:MAG: hypothetical protein LAP21_14950 [Acidobacteriia bacterium]|nr:hypothetical protein [Terriglobia bacterium]